MEPDHSQFCPCINCEYGGWQEKTDVKPHKCPVCNGSGKKSVDPYGYLHISCNACNGKGVVWG